MDKTRSDDLEASLRRAAAVATRVLNAEGILGYSGHIGVRLADGVLIQPRDLGRGEVTPESLLVVDMEGRVLAGPEGARPPDEVCIHTEILKARPDVGAVLHCHPDIATLFTLADGVALQPMKNHAVRWASGIPVHADASKIVGAGQGRDLAATLGAHHAALMRAHGAVIVAEDVASVTVDAVHFVENAETMYKAAMLGPVKPLSAEEMKTIAAHTSRETHVAKLWQYYTRRAAAAGVVKSEWL